MTTTTNTNTNLFADFGDVSYDEVKNLGGESKYPGLFLCQVKQAVLNISENGTTTIDIMLNICDEETRAVKKSVTLDTMFLRGVNGEVTDTQKRAMQKINNMRYLFNPMMPERTAWNVGIAPAKVWDKETKAFIEDKPTQQLLDLTGRYFWGILVCYQRYNSIAVNGYSRNPITSYAIDPVQHEAEKKDPETLYVKDYSEKTSPHIAIWGFYNIDTKQSLAEKLANSEPKEIDENIKLVADKHDENGFKEEEIPADKEISARKKALMKKLGKDFDEKKWSDYNSAVGQAVSNFQNVF